MNSYNKAVMSEIDYKINWLSDSIKKSINRSVLYKVSIITVVGNLTSIYNFLGYTDDLDLVEKLLLIRTITTRKSYLNDLPVFKIDNVTIDNDMIRLAITSHLTERKIDTNVDQVL